MRPLFPVAPFRCLFLEPDLMTITDFLRAEDGVATVDWVVLLAALTGLSVWLNSYLGGGSLTTTFLRHAWRVAGPAFRHRLVRLRGRPAAVDGQVGRASQLPVEPHHVTTTPHPRPISTTL
jgi:hypothetical protein